MQQKAKIERLLYEVDESGQVPDWVSQDPSAFLGDWYDWWVEVGGSFKGKNFHSIRNLALWLSEIGEIKSLPQKLKGNIRIKRQDTQRLVTVFLDRWRLTEGVEPDAKAPHVHQPFPSRDLAKLIGSILDALYPNVGADQSKGLLLRRNRIERSHSSERITSPQVLKEMFDDADALIVFSRHRSVSNENLLAQSMESFWQILNGFCELFDEDAPSKTVIWIVDIGNRQVEDRNAWRDFINVEILKAQFEAFAHFDSQSGSEEAMDDYQSSEARDNLFKIERNIQIPASVDRIERWKKLENRAVLIVERLRDEERKRLFPHEIDDDQRERVKDIGVFAEHLLPLALPVQWTKLTRLYPDQVREVSDVSFIATIDLCRGQTDTPPKVGYYAHVPALRGPARGKILQVKLDPPGISYDQAFQLAYASARYRLKERAGLVTKEKVSGGRIATRYLRKMGFEVLTIPDFFSLFHADPSLVK